MAGKCCARNAFEMGLLLTWDRKWFGYGIICFYALMIFAILDIGPVVWSLYVSELGISVCFPCSTLVSTALLFTRALLNIC